MARTVLPIVGAAVGAYFGGPTGAQIGYALGSVVGNAVDPVKVQGPKIGETGAQTTAEGVPRPIIYGTISCTGNVIVAGPLVITEEETQEGKGGGPVTTSERCFRTFAVRICEGPIAGLLRIWEDEKLVYDARSSSVIVQESIKWALGTRIYGGSEDQLPDSALENVYSDIPAFRGTAYIVFDGRDLTDRRGSIPQYRFEVSTSLLPPEVNDFTASIDIPVVVIGGQKQYQYIYLNNLPAVGAEDASVSSLLSAGWALDGSVPTHIHRVDDSLSIVNTTDISVVPGGNWASAVPTPSSNFFVLGSYGDKILCQGTNYQTGEQLYLTTNGVMYAMLTPDGSSTTYWYADNTAASRQNGRYVWMNSVGCYIGVPTRIGAPINNIYMWDINSSGGATSFRVNASASILGVNASPGSDFLMHLGRDGKLRVINDSGQLKTYSATLSLESTETLPFSLTNLTAFGVDGDVSAFAFQTGSVQIRTTSDWALTNTYTNTNLNTKPNGQRIIFTADSMFVQCQDTILRAPYIQGIDGGGILLSQIVDDIHARCDVPNGKWDTSELTDEVAGLLLAGDYTGADAVNTLRAAYFFDSFNADKKSWFPKRGADASFVLDLDDLVEDPDTSKREQAIEYPKKIHLQYQHANSGYAIVKATSARSSADAKVVGESTLSVPIVLNEDQAAQTVQKIHKVAWAEADGEIELSLPDSFIQYTPTDVGSVTLRGTTARRRITAWNYADGVIKVKMVKDRQSAYTSDVEGVPVPDPTPPPSTIVGATILAVMDIPSRIDTEDDLNIYYGVTGAMPAWHGAAVQRSVDAGANYTTVATITQASIMGYTSNDVADASEYFTDRTNTITVTLYRDGQSLDSYTDTQFLSEYGAFALEKSDGSWEIMQYRDVHQTSNGDFVLSTLHRGLLNSGTSSHASGSMFVMLQRPSHIEMTSSLIGQSLTHRAPSLEQSPEEAAEQTDTYLGRSQIEWPVAYLELTRSGTDISGTWTPRHRFGTDDNPVASINFQGYRVTIDGGSNGSVTFDTTTAGFTNYDASALGGGVTVTVSALNRITGAGPATSESI